MGGGEGGAQGLSPESAANDHIMHSYFSCPCLDSLSISTHPQNKTEKEGDNVTLFCEVTGNPTPTITWLKNGSPINASGNSRIGSTEQNAKLIITKVSREDSGEYQGAANNSLENVISRAATLEQNHFRFARYDSRVLLVRTEEKVVGRGVGKEKVGGCMARVGDRVRVRVRG